MLLYRRPPSATSPLWNIVGGGPGVPRRLTAAGSVTLGRVGLLLSASVLLTVAATRYGIGTDYWSRHVPMFIQIRNGWRTDYEPGFIALNLIVGYFTDDPQWLIALLSLLTIALVYRFIARMSLNPALSVLLFVLGGFYLETFNLAQQGLAIALLLNTIELALRRKHLAFVLVVLVATSIHSSALIWFAVWPLLMIRLNRFWRTMAAFGATALILGASQLLIAWAARIAPDYAWYLTSNYGDARNISLGVILCAFAAAVPFMLRATPAGEGDYSGALANLLLIGALLLVTAITSAYFFSRLVYYFTPVQMVAIPYLLATIRSAVTRRIIGSAYVVLYLSAFVYQFIVWNAHGVVPYESVLFH